MWDAIWSTGLLETGWPDVWPAHDLLATWCVVEPDVCTWVRAPLGFGFAALAGASFLRGSLIVHGATAEVVVLRAAGLIAIAAASLRWEERGLARTLLWIAVAAVALATYGQTLTNTGAGDSALIVGSDRMAVPCTHAGGRAPESESSAASTSAHAPSDDGHVSA